MYEDGGDGTPNRRHSGDGMDDIPSSPASTLPCYAQRLRTPDRSYRFTTFTQKQDAVNGCIVKLISTAHTSRNAEIITLAADLSAAVEEEIKGQGDCTSDDNSGECTPPGFETICNMSTSKPRMLRKISALGRDLRAELDTVDELKDSLREGQRREQEAIAELQAELDTVKEAAGLVHVEPGGLARMVALAKAEVRNMEKVTSEAQRRAELASQSRFNALLDGHRLREALIARGKRVEELEEEVEDLKGTVSHEQWKNKKNDRLYEEKRKKDEEIEALVKENRRLQVNLDFTTAEVRMAEAKVSELTGEPYCVPDQYRDDAIAIQPRDVEVKNFADCDDDDAATLEHHPTGPTATADALALPRRSLKRSPPEEDDGLEWSSAMGTGGKKATVHETSEDDDAPET
nr:hypothetical protein B0A51_00217 [Rachicladosporium sp. CCFEE 5018]